MNGEPFSLAAAEALFGQADSEHVTREVAAAPVLTPELRERLRSLLATARATRPAARTADAA